MMQVPLNNGKYAVIDDADCALISKYKWRIHRNISGNEYAINTIESPMVNRIRGKKVTISMHRLLMGLDGPQVDHIDNNGLNNQRANLRHVTNAQNAMNRRKNANCASRFKGVAFHKRMRRWRAQIQINNRRHHLGYFHSEFEAARAYDEAAVQHFGEYARINLIHEVF